jgi:hypothetical protein
MNDLNPYAPPAIVAEELPADFKPPEPSAPYGVRFLWALGRWTVICGISAGPSFYWGWGLHSKFHQVAAMLCGIGVFVLLYALAECSSWYARARDFPHLKTTLRVGYITRIAISLIVPLGMWLDMMVGLFSTAIAAQLLTGREYRLHGDENFSLVFATTLLQGLFLNVLLFGYMLLVLGILAAFGVAFKRPMSTQPHVA